VPQSCLGQTRIYRHVYVGYPGKLSLAVPPWVCKISTIDLMVTAITEEKGEFCVTVGPVSRTTGIPTQSVKGAGC